ncbi:hypothetical protein D3C86_734550 [compost metagenome]
MRNWIGVLTGVTLVAGCTAYTPFDSLQTSSALLATEGSVTVKATFLSGGYTTPAPVPQGYRTAAVVPNLTKAQIDHLKLSVFSVELGAETPLKDAAGADRIQTVTAADLESGLVVGGLTIGKTYRVKAVAYKAAESSPISGEVTAEFTLDKLKPTADLKIQLMDVLFNGEVAPGIEVTPSGELEHGGAVEIVPVIS